MAPLMIKQQNSMMQMQKLQPEIAKLQKKYGNDKNRLNEETMKLYQEKNINPAGGCLPLLIQFPIIIGLYQVIQRPVQYIMLISAENMAKIAKTINFTADVKLKQIEFATKIAENADLISNKLGINVSPINFNFFGLDLASKPSQAMGLLLIIPVLSAITAYLSSYVSNKLTGNTQQNEQMKSMTIIMPLMSAYFCYILEAGIGVYWIMGNIMQMFLQWIITITIKKKEEKENG
jgi:YidC/Oxa1 family membrane protein insertase